MRPADVARSLYWVARNHRGIREPVPDGAVELLGRAPLELAMEDVPPEQEPWRAAIGLERLAGALDLDDGQEDGGSTPWRCATAAVDAMTLLVNIGCLLPEPAPEKATPRSSRWSV